MNTDLKSVVVTGTASGIGNEILKQLASTKKYHIFATYRTGKQADLYYDFDKAYVTPVQLDLSDTKAIDVAVEKIQHKIGKDGLYGLINCAGKAYSAPLEYSSEEMNRYMIEVNLNAPAKLCKLFLPDLIQYQKNNKNKPRVINIISWAGIVSQPFINYYNASKFAFLGFSEAIHYEFGLKDIYVSAVLPGVTKTKLVGSTMDSLMESVKYATPEDKELYHKNFRMYANNPTEGKYAKYFPTSGEAAQKIIKVLETNKPRARYNIALDSKFMNLFMVRLFPTSLRIWMNKRIYGLTK